MNSETNPVERRKIAEIVFNWYKEYTKKNQEAGATFKEAMICLLLGVYANEARISLYARVK